MVDITGVGTSDVVITPYTDPDWNDTQFYETTSMLIGTTDPFASLDETYTYNNTIDEDNDGKTDYFMKKIKFNTNTAGTFTVSSSLRSSTGIIIDQWSDAKSYSTGENVVQFSFMGDNSYRKGIDGPYKVTETHLVDLCQII